MCSGEEGRGNKSLSEKIFNMNKFYLRFFILIFASLSFSQNTRIDTLKTSLSLNNFDKVKHAWLSKFRYREKEINGYAPNSYCWYSLIPLRDGFLIRAHEVAPDSTIVELIYPEYNLRKAQVNYRAPNIYYTLQQEIGIINNNGSNLIHKNYLAFTGISLLNPGLGMFYADFKNPVIKSNYFLITLYTIADVVFYAGLFSKDKDFKTLSYICLPGFRIVTFFSLPFLKWNNELIKTNYNFKFN